jgi:NAD(P)-dependent dehydrogenase (short-subunit alcohol dehydrogenase family)
MPGISNETGFVSYSTAIISSEPVELSKGIPYEELHDRVVLITGGAAGFGAAISDDLAKHGAIVIIGDVNVEAGQGKAAALRRLSGNDHHQFIQVDVTDWSSQVNFFKQAASLSPHRGIDCVIANAGICDPIEHARYENPPDYQSMENPPAPQMRTLNVNLNGVMYTTTLALSYLSRNPSSIAASTEPHRGPRDRNLLLVSSIAGLAPLPTLSIYCAAKHGVVGLFRALRVNAPITSGVRVNMISPYFVETAIMGKEGPLVMAGGAMAKIEDVVDAAVRLIADKSIIGRGLIVGARGPPDQVRKAGLELASGHDEQAIWDVYGHDFEQSDIFTRRVIAVTNIISAARGWGGVLVDIAAWATAPIRKLIGRS